MLEDLRETFYFLVEGERDGIITNLDDFVTQEVQDRLDEARETVADIRGKGTTHRQGQEVSTFYRKVRLLLAQALRGHLESRIGEFARAIYTSAESVAPRIRGASEGVIQQRLEAIESALQVATEGKKEEVSAFLSEMVLLLANFAAEPTAVGGKTVPSSALVVDRQETSPDRLGAATVSELLEQHYEIVEGTTGYTYERIFRPYIDTAASIQIEDPYIRLPHQVENFARFCALAVRLGSVKVIDLVTGLQTNDSTDDADSRLETLRRDLQSRGIILNWKRKTGLHDREIRSSNGWIIKIGRGLDIYHKPESWVSVEAADFSMRRCRQTKVDIFRNE